LAKKRGWAVRILGWMAGLLGIGAVGLAAYLYAPDKPRFALEALYPGEYRTVLGMRLRLRDTGPRDRPALILVHGFGSSLDTWEPWAQALQNRFRVIRLDLPGSGLSEPDPTGRYDDRRRYDRHNDDNDAIVAGVAGLAIGALIGSAIASDRNRPAPPPQRYAPQRYDSYQTQDRRAYDRGRICVSREEVWDGYQRRYITVETSRYC
jgi:hypothetical protein